MGVVWSQAESASFQTRLRTDIEVWDAGLAVWESRIGQLESRIGAAPGAELNSQAWNAAKTFWLERVLPLVRAGRRVCAQLGSGLAEYAMLESPLRARGTFLDENRLRPAVDSLNEQIRRLRLLERLSNPDWMIGPTRWEADMGALQSQVRAAQGALDDLVLFEARTRGLFSDEIALSATLASAVGSLGAGRFGSDGVWAPASGDGEPWLEGLAGFEFRPPAGLGSWSPEEAAAWWAGLSDRDQELACESWPGEIGNLDGVPMAWRAKANKIRLDQALDDVNQEIRRIEDRLAPPHPFGADLGALFDLADRLEDLKARREELEVLWQAANGVDFETGAVITDPDLMTGVVALVVSDDPSVPVKAAVSVGRVDAAENVLVMVSGMGSSPASAPDYLKHIGNLRDTAAGADVGVGPGQTAGIYWIGYDAPDGPRQAASTKWGRAGAPELAGFLEGFQASRERFSTDPHLSLVGHSYGGYTAGVAASLVEPGVVDEIIFTGTPGTGVSDASQLHVPPGHVFAVCAEPQTVDLGGNGRLPSTSAIVHDGVVDLMPDGSGGEGPNKLPGVTQLSGKVGPPKQVRTEGTPVVPEGKDPGATGWAFGLHMSYFDYGPDGKTPTPAQSDMARVIGGQR